MARLTARTAVRSGVIWGLIFGVVVASSAVSYASLYKTTAQRDALESAYGSNTAMAALFGTTHGLQTVAGFTVYKVGMTLSVLGAVWGLLTGTRLLRGEEDQGRWELLLAGPTTRRRATAQALAGLAAGVGALWAVTAVLTTLVGTGGKISFSPAASAYLALALVATAVMFLGVGAVTSQLAPTRRQAATWAAVVLGASYALRMVADAGIGLHGLVWASPLGWVEELQPLVDPRPGALVPIVLLTGALAVTAVHLAGRRDVGEGLRADRTHARPRLRLLTGPVGLAVRLTRPTVVAWWAAIVVAGLLYGMIARSAGATVTGSSVHEVLTRLGATGTGTAEVLGACFLVLAVLVSFAGAGQLTAARSEEAAGRLEHLVVRPVTRARWLGGRLAVTVVVLVVAGLASGTAAWIGSATQHGGVPLPTLLAAGLNLVPPAVLIVGLGVAAFGVVPRRTATVVYGYLGWSLLVVVVGGIGRGDRWVLDTSVFHQMASAPATPPHWAADGVMVLVGAVAALAGGLAFRRRDLEGA